MLIKDSTYYLERPRQDTSTNIGNYCLLKKLGFQISHVYRNLTSTLPTCLGRGFQKNYQTIVEHHRDLCFCGTRCGMNRLAEWYRPQPTLRNKSWRVRGTLQDSALVFKKTGHQTSPNYSQICGSDMADENESDTVRLFQVGKFRSNFMVTFRRGLQRTFTLIVRTDIGYRELIQWLLYRKQRCEAPRFYTYIHVNIHFFPP